jgi:hypothetical protein
MSVRGASWLRTDRGLALLNLALALGAVGAWRVGVLPPRLDALMRDVVNSGPSQRDVELETQNYYEVLMDVDHLRWAGGGLARFVSGLLKGERETEQGGNWVRIRTSDLVLSHEEEFLPYELKPDFETVYMGVPVRTNRWGMRDRDYELAKPPGTFRIALVESSNGMGYGVEVQDSFPKVLEALLNAELAGRGFERYEVLNFSVGGYELLHRLYVADRKVPPFQPDLILMGATMHDLRWQIYEAVVKRLRWERDLHYDFLRELVGDAGLRPGDEPLRIRRRLRPRREALAREVFAELRRIGEREGVPVVLVNFRLRVDPIHPEMIRQTELAREAGLPTLEVFDAYEGRSDSEMYLTPLDAHPSAKAHRLLAEELLADLLADEAVHALLLGETRAPTQQRAGAR